MATCRSGLPVEIASSSSLSLLSWTFSRRPSEESCFFLLKIFQRTINAKGDWMGEVERFDNGQQKRAPRWGSVVACKRAVLSSQSKKTLKIALENRNICLRSQDCTSNKILKGGMESKTRSDSWYTFWRMPPKDSQ